MMTTEKAPRVVLAPNPSPLTGPGTNTFLLGMREIAVIDPGPNLPEHRAAILDAAGSGRITHIFVTHAHRDHSEGVPALARETGATVLGFGPPEAGRSPAMLRLLESGYIGGGEGLDQSFAPDRTLADGETVSSPEWSLTALHTPGHFGGHLSFIEGGDIYCGDVVMGWSSTLISPPDGDLADYMRSLARLAALKAHRLIPAHGDPITAPAARLAELAAHRKERTAQILAALREEPGNAESLARRIYDVDERLIRPATRNVLAHLIALEDLGVIRTRGKLEENSIFEVS